MRNEGVKNHIKHLMEKHTDLEVKLHQAETSHASDAEITHLKKEKLVLKDEISRLQEQLDNTHKNL